MRVGQVNHSYVMTSLPPVNVTPNPHVTFLFVKNTACSSSWQRFSHCSTKISSIPFDGTRNVLKDHVVAWVQCSRKWLLEYIVPQYNLPLLFVRHSSFDNGEWFMGHVVTGNCTMILPDKTAHHVQWCAVSPCSFSKASVTQIPTVSEICHHFLLIVFI